MARPAKEVEAKKKPVVVEVKTQEKPSPLPSPAPQKPLSSAALANAFDLLDEDSSDLISIVDAKEDDAFVAAERNRIEEEKKAARESKIKAREEEKKAAREAKKRAIQEKKVYEASILRFHSARPNLSFSRPSALASDGVQSQLAKNLSGLELQAKESQGAPVEQEAASVDGSSSKSSDGRRRANMNGSLRRKQKKKKAEGEKKEGKDQQEKQDSNNGAPVVNSNYPRSYTLKEYEEKKKREEDEKNKKADAINNGMDHRQQRFDNGGPRRFANGGPRRFNNGGQRFDKQQALAEEALVKEDASFSLEDADFPVLEKQVPAVKAPAEEVVAGKAVVAKAPTGKSVAGKAVAKKIWCKESLISICSLFAIVFLVLNFDNSYWN